VSAPPAEIEEARLERLAQVAGRLLRGRPLHQGGHWLHPRPAPGGLEFLDHRPLMPGDDPRHLDWRASARNRQPLVRRYRDERAGEWIICLDRSASMGAAQGVWPLARQLASALSFLLLNLEHRVGLAVFSGGLDGFLPPGRGRTAYVALRRALQSAEPRETGGASRLNACLPVLTRSRQVAVISDFLTPDGMRGDLEGVIARCEAVHLFQVFGEPLEPIPEGPLVIEDAESGERMLTLADRGLTARVADRRTALRRELAGFCRRNGALYSASPVGKPWDRVVLDHLVGPEARLA
jgi:uncharacterized protein (DUF58 family)